MDLYLSQYFDLAPGVVENYGAFDISVASDLPLFIDPFLLFNSDKPEYQALHEGILKYLGFLRDKSVAGSVSPGLVKSWYHFKEVKQNWLGFTVLGNDGSGLGASFAKGLNSSLGAIFTDFGNETVTKSSHLEKVAIVGDGVGRDGISDFTTCLIKYFLLEYTQTFARKHLKPEQCDQFAVEKAVFDYATETWKPGTYYLPVVRGDFVLLTPVDILTRDDTWISSKDLHHRLRAVIPSVPDDTLRDQISNYLEQALTKADGSAPTPKEASKAVRDTLAEFPLLIDYYIKYKEDHAVEAVALSSEKVADTYDVFVEHLKALYEDLAKKTDFLSRGWSSLDEAHERVLGFKQYVEHNDGYQLINRKGEKPFSNEKEVQLFFGLIWFGTAFDVNREPNNGRGPVDFKVSLGAADKSLIEFKLASNTKLKQNLEAQLAIYEAANQTRQSISVIICYTQAETGKVAAVLNELHLIDDKYIVVIDGRSDNKPSGSKAKMASTP